MKEVDQLKKTAARGGGAKGVAIEQRTMDALRLVVEVFARFEGPLGILEAALAGRASSQDPSSPEIVRHLFADRTRVDRVRELVNTYQLGTAVLRNQLAAYSLASKERVPIERHQKMYAIPVYLVQEAARALIAAPDDWSTDPLIGPLLRSSFEGFRSKESSFEKDELESETRAGDPASNWRVPVSPPAQVSKTPSVLPELVSRARDLIKTFTDRLNTPPQVIAPSDPNAEKHAGKALRAISRTIEHIRAVYTNALERIPIVEGALAIHTGASQRLTNSAQEGQAKTIARFLGDRPPMLQRCHVAVRQVVDLRRELYLADQALKTLANLPSAELLAQPSFDLAVLRGKAIPVANFWRTFASDPVLNALFPAPIE